MNWTLTGNIRRLKRKSLIGQLVLLALGVELLVFASFTSFQLPTPTQRNLEHGINHTAQQAISYLPASYQERALAQFPVLRQDIPAVRNSPYVPLVPVAIFLGYILGTPLGWLSAAVFILLGLVGPLFGVLPFAAGGGI